MIMERCAMSLSPAELEHLYLVYATLADANTPELQCPITSPRAFWLQHFQLLSRFEGMRRTEERKFVNDLSRTV